MVRPAYPFLTDGSLLLRPSKTTDPRAWEKSWTEDLARFYSRSPRKMRRFINAVDKTLLSYYDTDGLVIGTNKQENGVIIMQKEFFARVVQDLAHGDFESRWKASGREVRETHILKALCNASNFHQGHSEQQRIVCPEITLENLSSDHGDTTVFVEFLKKILPPLLPTEENEIHEMVYLEHPHVEALLALTESEKKVPGACSYTRHTRTNRMAFMTTVLWSTFISFVSRPRSPPLPSIVAHVPVYAYRKVTSKSSQTPRDRRSTQRTFRRLTPLL